MPTQLYKILGDAHLTKLVHPVLFFWMVKGVTIQAAETPHYARPMGYGGWVPSALLMGFI